MLKDEFIQKKILYLFVQYLIKHNINAQTSTQTNSFCGLEYGPISVPICLKAIAIKMLDLILMFNLFIRGAIVKSAWLDYIPETQTFTRKRSR